MNYTLSTTHRMHISPATCDLLERRMRTLGRHIPARLQSQPLQLHLRENLNRNYVEGMAILSLKGKTLTAKYKGQNINQVVTQLIERMRKQVVSYQATHDAWHSDYPDKRTIRTKPEAYGLS
jgi:ribosome-associated translation inhibitor RaiA